MIPSPGDARQRSIERRMGRCRHFTGMQHESCEAGVRYADVRDESTRPFGFPCIASQAGNSTCAKLDMQTREEAEAEDRESDAAIQRVITCIRAIRERHGKARGIGNVMPCPTGCGGTLRYSIADYNGHIHGACSTENCARWME